MWSGIVGFASRVRFAFVRSRVDDEVRQEFEIHLELLIERYVRSGMSADDARRAARVKLDERSAVVVGVVPSAELVRSRPRNQRRNSSNQSTTIVTSRPRVRFAMDGNPFVIRP
jgi:hypothetical protein